MEIYEHLTNEMAALLKSINKTIGRRCKYRITVNDEAESFSLFCDQGNESGPEVEVGLAAFEMMLLLRGIESGLETAMKVQFPTPKKKPHKKKKSLWSRERPISAKKVIEEQELVDNGKVYTKILKK